MIKIVIADDHKLFAQGLANILGENPEFTVCAVFNDGRSLIDYLSNQHADIAIIDLNMPNFDGKSTLKKLVDNNIEIKKMVLSMYAEEALIKECIEIGIDAYLMKDAEPETLYKTIKDVVNNTYLFNANGIVRSFSNHQFKDDFINKYKLSKREVEVIKLIVDGLTNSRIADKLFLSTFTIDTHRKNILQKLDAKNTAELVKLALEQGLN